MSVNFSQYKKSNELLKKALKTIPLGSQTFSKSYLQYPSQASPLFLTHGKGSKVWDVDGNEYIDFVNGLLCISLGYCYPEVDKAIQQQLAKGSIFSLPSPLEQELAEVFVQLIPCAEMVRFGKNGSDVTSGAVRLARAYTGRDRIAVCGYHGWHDWYIGVTTRNKGVPEAVSSLTSTFIYNDINSLKELFQSHPNQFAAVIMEPENLQAPKDDFLNKVKDLTHKHGAVLIFDEIITGFRWSLGGAQAYYKVTPDLATFGKGMANGLPISALVGRKEIMKQLDEVFYSFTFGGETLSIAAALATIKVMQAKSVINHFWTFGQKIIDEVNRLIKEVGLNKYLKITGKPPWSHLLFTDSQTASSIEIKSYFLQEVIKRGILTLGSHNVSFSHSQDDVEKLIKVYADVFVLIKDAIEKGNIKQRLTDKPIKPLFKIR